MKLPSLAVLLFTAVGVASIKTEGNLRRSLEDVPLVLPVIRCTSDEPCGLCQGDCQTDADCAGDLVCFHKYGKAMTDEEATVPGCVGLDYSRTDWCVEPSMVTDHPNTPAPTAEESHSNSLHFNRIATFPVCLQLDPNCNVDDETVSEIIYASKDGNTLVYTDGTMGMLGFIDITDPANPLPAGVVDVGGEPTSTAVLGPYAIVVVNTSPSYTEPSGIFHVIDIATQEVLRTGDLGGQPDSISISPDETYIAIVIENERDEDFGDGRLPQFPPGFLVIMDASSDDVNEWTMSTVNLTGLDGVLYPEDPEPEYVDINADNIAVVTLQENNAIVLVNLTSGEVINSFSAGSVDIDGIDIVENGVIEQTGSQQGLLREPDGVAWIGTEYFATADEGDMDGGSRTFTIWGKDGTVVYSSGAEIEDWATRLGHYPEGRSESKGAEPETVRYADFGERGMMLFVTSERSSLVFVYDVSDVMQPVLRQVLPAGGVGPEGIYAIPERGLVVVANENDARDDAIRGAVSIFELQDAAAVYPTLWSSMDDSGKYIPFSALSGLASYGTTLFSIEDSFYKSSRIFVIDSESMPATVEDSMHVLDSDGILAAALTTDEAAVLLNADMSVNLDQEGIDVIGDLEGFWIVSEGSGTVDDPEHPVETPNLLVRLDAMATIQEVVMLPDDVNAIQVRYGFEGVAVDGENVVVAFQREWVNETDPRLGIYNTATSSWKFVMYPLDVPESQNGGWVGLSDIESLGDGVFLVLERDNQGGLDAAIKRVYSINFGDYSIADGTLIEKTLVRDLLPDLMSYHGQVVEKIEGLTVDGNGDLWVNNDNDGVDDNSGEQLLLNLGPL